MAICCSCGQFKLWRSYTADGLPRSSSGRCIPFSWFPPAMRWGGGRIACPVSPARRPRVPGAGGVRASAVDSYESSSEFVKRMEQAWLISQQPRPIACSSCKSNGYVECKWCRGTGFFILGDNMLCEVPSRNTTCVICAGKGSARCTDCKGTGFRAKWLGEPPPTHPRDADQT